MTATKITALILSFLMVVVMAGLIVLGAMLSVEVITLIGFLGGMLSLLAFFMVVGKVIGGKDANPSD